MHQAGLPEHLQRKRKATEKRFELSANKKRLIAEDMVSQRSQFAAEKDFWPAMEKKHGLSKQTLSNILSKREQYQKLAQQPLQRRSTKNRQRVRAGGAGRKVPYAETLASLSQWLALERSFGHTISKADIMAEFSTQLRMAATKDRKLAEDPKLSTLQGAKYLQDATEKEERLRKLSGSKSYSKSFTARVLKWINAKYTTTEVVSNISALESETRCKLTWQEIDHCLWLASLSTLPELSAAKVVVRPEEFIAQRPKLVLGFSDQVPLWAKTAGKKAVFSASEMHLPEHRSDFSEVRQAIAEVMHDPAQADMLVAPFSTPRTPQSTLSAGSQTPQLAKAASTESLATPKKKLSFDQAQTPENSQADTAAAAAELQTSKDAAAEAQPEANQAQTPENSQADKARAALPQAGSLTTQGFSAADRYRITYEARQVLFEVCAESTTEIKGHVAKGLLVVPGQWARLSNISADGKWIQTETFQVGSKTVTHSAGASAGRALESYRKLRASHPELVAEVDIMSQPAANVDSVILSWVLQAQAEEFPCSVWQRDCFSSVFSASATESMAAAQQISCLVAAKCTSKLQITDSDFAKQFKSFVRKKLVELRTEFQASRRDLTEVWRVGAKELVTAVVWAQQKMRDKNLYDEWVLRAAVRNGLLVWRPNLQTGQLEELTSQPWAKELGLEMGSRRFPVAWLSDRLKWLSEGKPKVPDWDLSHTAANISELQRWDYYNPEEDAENEVDEQPDLDCDFAAELELPLQNSLNLRIHPRLRRAALRRAVAEQENAKTLGRKLDRRPERKERASDRKELRGKLVQALRSKLQGHSRAELLQSIVPHVKPKGVKLSSVSKPSAKNKPSAKKKASLKLKPSAKKKAAKKHLAKQLADKEMPTKRVKGKQAPQGKFEDHPPLPPPSQPPADGPAPA